MPNAVETAGSTWRRSRQMNSGAASVIVFGGCAGAQVILIREADLAVNDLL